MRASLVLAFGATLLLGGAPSAGAAKSDSPLQTLIDAAKPGQTVTVPPGVHVGQWVIDKAIVLDGGNQAILDGGGKGTIILIKADGATVRNLRIRNSGESHNDEDSGIQIRGKFNVVKDNVIEDCLFGIDLVQSDSNIVRRNAVSSKPVDLGVRGDAIRLWYSEHNKILENTIDGSRDTVVWYSGNNEFKDNVFRNGRYGLHFMFGKYNLVENNRFSHNVVGIFLMYSEGVVIRNNHITHGQGVIGMGIGLKEASNVDVIDNRILYSSTGVYLDLSPFEPDATNRIIGNIIGYNGLGIMFLNDWPGNVLADNRIEANIRQVTVQGRGGATRNQWERNFWDDYDGFDRNQDGFGDQPYDIRLYADRLWVDVPHAAFFLGSPVLTAIDFLERLAPLTEPIVLLRDAQPRMAAVFKPDLPAPRADVTGTEEKKERYDPFGLGSGKGK